MRVTKRFISIIIALMMVVTLLPVYVSAAETLVTGTKDYSIDGTRTFSFMPDENGLYEFHLNGRNGTTAWSQDMMDFYKNGVRLEPISISQDTSGVYESVSFFLIFDGGTEYTVDLHGFGGEYTLSVLKTDAVALTSSVTENFMLPTSSSYHGQMISQKYFSFAPLSSGWYTFNSSNADAWLEVLGNFSGESPVGAAGYLEVGHVYYIRVAAWNFGGGACDLIVAPSNFPRVSGGDSPKTILLAPDLCTTYVSFTPSTSESYRVSVNNDKKYRMFAICDATGNFLSKIDEEEDGKFGTDVGDDIGLTRNFVEGTTYYIAIMGVGQATAEVSINTGERETVTNRVTIETGYDEGQKTAEVDASWNDDWFRESATTYRHELAITSMALSGAAYIEFEDGPNEGKPNPANVESVLADFGFADFRSVNYDFEHTRGNNDVVALTIASKEIQESSGNYTLVAVVVKGTSKNEEWYSNFNIGTKDKHDGFNSAKSQVVIQLMLGYLSPRGLDSSNTKFLITGHSRGAAVANLLAADLNTSVWAEKENVFAYTFATPAVSTKAIASGYENIFNIVTGEDFVPQLPLSKPGWGYKRYGIDLFLPSQSYYKSGSFGVPYSFESVKSKMISQFYELTGEVYEFYPDGTQKVDVLVRNLHRLAPTSSEFSTKKHVAWLVPPAFRTTSEYFDILASILIAERISVPAVLGGARLLLSTDGEYTDISKFFIWNGGLNSRIHSVHSMVGYYSWLSSCTAYELFGNLNDRSYPTFKRLQIACPVDVLVYNADGDLVASVINEVVVLSGLAVGVEEGVKTIDLPSDQEYSIEIVAYDAGTVDYQIDEMVVETTGSRILRSVYFDDIAIENGDTLAGNVADAHNNLVGDYALTLNEQTIIYADKDMAAEDDGDTGNNDNTNTSSSSGSSKTTSVSSSAINISGFENGTVTVSKNKASKGDEITLTVVPDVGYELDTLTITDKDGKTVDYTKGEDGRYIFIMPVSAVIIDATFKEMRRAETVSLPFTDVSKNAWFYNAVKYVYENDLFSGTSTTTFNPNVSMTRSMMVTVLYRLAGYSASGENVFVDVPDDAWYTNAVSWAAANGIVSGVGNDRFAPAAEITREQMAVMLYNYCTYKGITLLAVSETGNFSDITDISAWAAEAVQAMYQAGILNGKENNIFDPKGTATRAEVAQMFMNFMEAVE